MLENHFSQIPHVIKVQQRRTAETALSRSIVPVAGVALATVGNGGRFILRSNTWKSF